jgi:hypothetical protein
VIWLRVSAIVELAMGIALLIAPSAVLDALIGSSEADGPLVGRVLGGALSALGVAGALADRRSPDLGLLLAFVVYNASAAAILAVAGVADSADGALLWPVVTVHALIAVTIARLLRAL